MRKALPKHDGQYKCNNVYSNYHTLYVNKPAHHHTNNNNNDRNMIYTERNYDENSMSSSSIFSSLLSTEDPYQITAAEIITSMSTTNSSPTASTLERAVITTALALTSSSALSTILTSSSSSLATSTVGETTTVLPLLPSTTTTTAMTTEDDADPMLILTTEKSNETTLMPVMIITTTVDKLKNKNDKQHHHHRHHLDDNRNNNININLNLNNGNGNNDEGIDVIVVAGYDDGTTIVDVDTGILDGIIVDKIDAEGVKETSIQFNNSNFPARPPPQTNNINKDAGKDESRLDVSFSHEDLMDTDAIVSGRKNMDFTNILKNYDSTGVSQGRARDNVDDSSKGRDKDNDYDIEGVEIVDDVETKRKIQNELTNDFSRVHGRRGGAGGIATMTTSNTPATPITESNELFKRPSYKIEKTSTKGENYAIFSFFLKRNFTKKIYI